MKWDKGNTPVMPQILPGTTIRIRAPWQKKASAGSAMRGTSPKLRLVEPAKKPDPADPK